MKRIILNITMLLLVKLLFAQKQDVWIRFYDTATEMSGYKDTNGSIKIPPKFKQLARADSFYNIIAVSEYLNGSYQSYYLLKNGSKVGKDSVYTFDFTADCESEGKIIFYDRKTDRVGFFNQDGAIAIPAIYNAVSPFRNGVAIAYRNARRWCWGGEDTANCEHLGWKGGEAILINDKNEILADSLDISPSSINWYSLKINTKNIDTSTCIIITGRNNFFYSFIDFEKEFSKWFHNEFLTSLNTKDNVDEFLFEHVTYWSEKKGWTDKTKTSFIDSFSSALTSERFKPNKFKEVSISLETTFSSMSNNKSINKYYNACGEQNKYKFPVFDVMLTYYKKSKKSIPNLSSDFYNNNEIDYQEHFQFLRTENGYRLIEVSFKKMILLNIHKQ